MMRLFGSLLVITGVLCVGILPTKAAAEDLYTVVLAESEEQTREQILIIVSPDSLSHPLIKSLLSSYVQNLSDLSYDTLRLRDTHKDDRNAQPTVGTNVSNAISGGTDSVRTAPQQPVGTGAGVTPTPTTLQLVELYPNTSGDDAKEEYVLLKNTGDATVPLSGWTMKDTSGKTFTFADGSITPGATLKLPREQSQITLNNDSDSISLFSPSQQLIDSVSYENAKQGDPYLRQGTVWYFASQVPTAEPTIVPTVQVEPVADDTVGTTKEEKQKPAPKTPVPKPSVPKPSTVMIAVAKEKPDETFAKISGAVTVLPGVLGKQFLYVEDETGGIQVFKHDANFPELQIGSVLSITGEMSTINGERRLKVSKNGSIEASGSLNELVVPMKKIEEITSASTGSLIKTNGVLSAASADHLELEESGQKLEVAIASYTGIDTSTLTVGARMEITGIMRPSGERAKLYPRSQMDLVVIEETPPIATGIIESGKTTQQKRDQTIATIIGAASGAALIIWIVKQHLSKKHETYASPLAVTTETVH